MVYYSRRTLAVFEYKGLNASGDVIAGTMTADTPQEGRRALRENGLRIHRFEPVAEVGPSQWLGSLRSLRTLPSRLLDRSARRADRVAEFARHLALLLRSGVPLAESIDVLIAQEKHVPFETVLRATLDHVRGGVSLADALADHPRWFDVTFLSAVRVGQRSGGLEHALTELADFLKDKSKLRSQVTAALTYPAILMVLGIAVTLFLMMRVIPQLMTVLVSSGKPLPAATAMLKSCTDILVNHWLVLLAAALIIATAGVLTFKSKRGRRFAETFVLRLPIVGSLVRRTLVARFAQQMTMLLGSGIPFLEAVGIVRGSENHLLLRDELDGIAKAIEAGSDIAPTLKNSRVFPPLVVHLVAVGQSAGELPQMLSELRAGYETEVKLALTKFTAALEPMLIVLMAGMIGFVIFATVMPILQVTETMR